MADSSSANHQIDLEKLTTKTKDNLQNWKEAIVHSKDVFLWKKPHHAPLLAGIVSLTFLIIYAFDATVLTTFSLIGIFLCLADYAVPLISVSLFDPSQWGQTEEDHYNEICSALASTWVSIATLWAQCQEMKDSRPKVYSALLLSVLITLAWIGNVINNLLLTYLIALFVILYPGLSHHGIVEKYAGKVVTTVKGLIGDKFKQN